MDQVDVFFEGLAGQAPLENGVNTFDPGPRHGVVRCATVPVQNLAEVHCIWADSSTFGHIAVAWLSEAEAARLVVRMRADLEQPR